MKTAYFDYNGIPAFIEYKKFPVKLVNGKKIVEYDLQKFFTSAQVITKAQFDKMISK
jgi:hypothetical protein